MALRAEVIAQEFALSTILRGSGREYRALDEIAVLERERDTETIGPKFYAQRRRELTDELAIVLRMKSEATGH